MIRQTLVLVALVASTLLPTGCAAPQSGNGDLSSSWHYRAGNFSLEGDRAAAAYTIEVLAKGKRVLLDGLTVSASASILSSGEFQQIEYGLSGAIDPSLNAGLDGVPRGWRRHHDVLATDRQPQALFEVDRSGSKSFLEPAHGGQSLRADTACCGRGALLLQESGRLVRGLQQRLLFNCMGRFHGCTRV